MVLRNIVGTPFGPDGVQSLTKKYDHLNCKGAIDDFVRQIMRGSRIGTQLIARLGEQPGDEGAYLQIRDGRIACKEITLQGDGFVSEESIVPDYWEFNTDRLGSVSVPCDNGRHMFGADSWLLWERVSE
jgi:hypothetical protein